jgi:hypothetical protein
MNAYQVVEALSASFFALLGIWAAVVRRHWFLRFVVVSAFLLLTLLIPAYEVIVEFGLQMILIMAGVWLVQERKDWRPRLSVETALLAMVVVAVAAAVVSRIPHLVPAIWAYLITVGVCTGYVGLLALWVVCGNAPLRQRAFWGILGLVLFVVLFHFGHAVQHALWRSTGGFNRQALFEFYKRDETIAWLIPLLPTIALAAAILIGVLSLARASRWFSLEPPTDRAALPRGAIAARLGLAGILLAVMTPLAYLLYRLATPPSMELLADLPSPNGFDDFVAAGNMTPGTIEGVPRSWPTTRAAFEKHYNDVAPVAERISDGLRKPILVPLESSDSWMCVNPDDADAVWMASKALHVRMQYLFEYGTPQDAVDAAMLLLRFGYQACQGAVSIQQQTKGEQTQALQVIRVSIPRLSGDQCRNLANELWQLEGALEPHESKEDRQIIADKNRGWTVHLSVLLDQWSGESFYDMFRQWNLEGVADLRLLAADLAAQAFYLDQKRLPNSLSKLVPDYLPAIPQDVYAESPMQYRLDGETYLIYSVGPDGIDWLAHPGLTSNDEVAVRGPHLPPLWLRLRDGTVEGFKALWKSGANLAEPIAE